MEMERSEVRQPLEEEIRKRKAA